MREVVGAAPAVGGEVRSMEPDRPAEGRERAPLAAIALGLALGIALDRSLDPWSTAAWAWGGAGLAALALGPARRGARWLLVLVAAVALGGAWHHQRWSDLPPDDLARRVDGPTIAWVRGVLTEVPVYRPPLPPMDRGYTQSALAVAAVNSGQGWEPARGRLRLNVGGDRTDLRMGEPVEAAGTLEPIPGPLNPGEYDARDALRAEGIRLRLSVDDPDGVIPAREALAPWPWTRRLGALRAASLERLDRTLPQDVRPLAAALILGRREGVDPEINDAFARTGTTHVLAISGLHLQVVAAAFLGLGTIVGGGFRAWRVAVMAAVAGYALLVGLMPSVTRSAAMTMAFCVGGLADRPAGRANVLALAAIATLLMNPAYLFDAGCQLSFLAVAAIFWGVGPALDALRPILSRRWRLPLWMCLELTPLDRLELRLAPWWRRIPRRLWMGLLGALVASAVVWAATAPLIALRFHLVSPLGIALNLPVIPLTSAALLAGGLGLLVGGPASAACAWLLRMTERIVRWGAEQRWGYDFTAGPGAGWVLGFYALLALWLLARLSGRGASRRAVAAGVALGLWCLGGWAIGRIPPGSGRPALTAEVLSVGHGLSVLVRGEDGTTLLYDCGRMGDPRVGRRVIAPALWARGVRRIDELILSHADADHYNGLPDLIDRFPIGAVRVPPGFAPAGDPHAAAVLDLARRRGVPVGVIRAGDRLPLGPHAQALVRHPPADWDAGAPDNDRSVVLELVCHDRRAWLTGDLDGGGLARVLAEAAAPVDALLAPHHGGRTANPPVLYDRTRPGLVLVSQRRPLPGVRDALAELEDRPLDLLRTWETGAVEVRWDGPELQARTFLDRPTNEVRHEVARPSYVPRPRTAGLSLPRGLAIALGILLGLGACGLLAVVEWGAWTLVRPGRSLARLATIDPPWERIAIQAGDGTTLVGAWRGADGAPTGRLAVLLHGFAEDHTALYGRGEALAARGWSVLIPDARGRGRSGGAWTTFGVVEGGDVRAWIDATLARTGPGTEVVVWGRSMGAATALHAAAQDDRIRALVLEAPYAELRASVAAWLGRWHLPGGIAGLMLRRAGALAGVGLLRPGPLDWARRVRVPTLIVRGAEDRLVPEPEVERLAAALPAAPRREVVPGARHTDVFDRGGPALAETIADFLEGATPTGPGPA